MSFYDLKLLYNIEHKNRTICQFWYLTKRDRVKTTQQFDVVASQILEVKLINSRMSPRVVDV